MHHVQKAKEFVGEIRNLGNDPDEIMASFDKVSLFKKIPVNLSLNVVHH